MEQKSKEFNELLQFISALVIRRIAQLEVRSIVESKASTHKDGKDLFKIAGSLTQEFKDEKFQQTRELAETSQKDQNLSPYKYALMWAEAMPLGAGIEDVKDNFPETDGIASKLLKIKSGHPANLRENYFAFGGGFEKYGVLMPTQEKRLPRPLNSDLSSLFSELFNEAKNLISKVTESNYIQKLMEILRILEPVPVQQKNGELTSLAGYLRSSIVLGISLLKEMQIHGPTAIQDAKEPYWCLTAITFNAFGDSVNSHGKFVDFEKTKQRLSIDIKREIGKIIKPFELHIIESTRTNKFYLMYNKTAKDELETALADVCTKMIAEKSAVLGFSSQLINEETIRNNDNLAKNFTLLDEQAHQNTQQKFLTVQKTFEDNTNSEKPKKKDIKINSPELVAKFDSVQTREPVMGYLLIKTERTPDSIINVNNGLNDIFYQNDRFSKFWQKLPSELLDKLNLKRNIIYQSRNGFLVKSQLTRLLYAAKEFFISYFNAGFPVSISASIINSENADDEYNFVLLNQSWRDARNYLRPKIRADKDHPNPFSGFRGSSIAFSFLDDKSKNIIPSEDLSIFFEMTRQVASLADYRMNHTTIEPMQSPKPDIFQLIHSQTTKLKNKTYNWRATLYYMLKNKLVNEIDEVGKQNQQADSSILQALNNLFSTLSTNRWQRNQRLMSRPAEDYLNVTAKWLSVIELL